VDNLASLVSQHEEHVEDPKRGRGHSEEIDGSSAARLAAVLAGESPAGARPSVAP